MNTVSLVMQCVYVGYGPAATVQGTATDNVCIDGPPGYLMCEEEE